MKHVLIALTTLTALALPARADNGCYMEYPGQTIDLGDFCGGQGTISDTFRFEETLPQVENVAMQGNIAQGRALVGEIYNPNAQVSDGVTVFYAVHTNTEIKQGTLIISSLEPYSRERVEIVLPNLRGIVQDYEFEILN